MKKMITLVCFLLAIGMAANAFGEDKAKCNWSTVKAEYEQAIKNNLRINSMPVCRQEVFEQLPSFMEKAELVKLEMLALDGSYSDFFRPSLAEYLELYHRQILLASDDLERQKYFKKELEGLIYIFETLNYQVKTSEDFEKQAREDFAKSLGYSSSNEITSADIEKKWDDFKKGNSKYAAKWPGYAYAQHHDSPLWKVEDELKKLPPRVTLEYYKYVVNCLELGTTF